MDPMKFAQMLADGTDAVEDMVWKIKRKLDHGEDLSSADLMNGYTKVYDLCSDCPLKLKPFLVRHFFDKFKIAVKVRISEKVIPSLENKEDEALVRQLAEAWIEHKKFTRHLLFMFLSLTNVVLSTPQPLPADCISLTLFCDMIASGWPWDQEEELGLPSYDQFSDFIKESDSRLVSIEEKFEELMSHFSKTLL
ncbi:hypothetical protein TIFTF001_013070 [Ficus carica]|uniref:Uncharacterized protein n=1 Tax=Ficus carica TaxID=3494 RepID=A0AA88A175_FICCA|nr:hypothetical protein TIFTF001_013070 [Ficus carica]